MYGSQLLTVAGWSMPSFFPVVALAILGWTLNCGGRSRSTQRIGRNGRVEAGPKSALRAETCPVCTAEIPIIRARGADILHPARFPPLEVFVRRPPECTVPSVMGRHPKTFTKLESLVSGRHVGSGQLRTALTRAPVVHAAVFHQAIWMASTAVGYRFVQD